MAEEKDSDACSDSRPHSESSTSALTGTTLRVYRFLYRTGEPQGIHDVQSGLRLSSPSVASYHLKKLLAMGLIKESKDAQKYFVDRIVFENMIRFRRSLIPIQLGYAAFFATALVILLVAFRPAALSGAYVFSALIIVIACAVFAYQAFRSLKSVTV